MLTFAMLEQLDHFKLDKKLMDANGKVTDTVRAPSCSARRRG